MAILVNGFFQRCRGVGGAFAFAAFVACCVAVFAVWWGNLNQDEGWYLYAASLVRGGKLPYRDFFFTQGPTLPYVYALLAPVWGAASPLHGLLGGRLVTLAFSLAGTALACLLARRLAPAGRKGAAACATFALLAANLYHVYFTAIPKTYALGAAFVFAGFLLLARFRPATTFAAGIAFALASGTRISLVLVLGVVGVFLLARFRAFRWQFLWFGLGGVAGLAATYGYFACDAASRTGLLAAQAFHAARGGFDPFFALGAVSRLARGYAAAGGVLFAAFFFGARPAAANDEAAERARALAWMMGLSFAAVFLLQLSAPFPYDDYQVPIMGLVAVLVAVRFVARVPVSAAQAAWFAAFLAALASFASPLLQEWAVYGQDRFWSVKKECTELAKLRRVARRIDALDPGGKTILTQDAYLAVETGRALPDGFELGPFAYYRDAGDEEARAIRTLNRAGLEATLRRADAAVAAVSGYDWAIAAPAMTCIPETERARTRAVLEERYEPAFVEERFGQNATRLVVYRRKDAPKGGTGNGR